MSKRAVVHIEIPTNDLEKSSAFYAELFGWKMTPYPDMNYVVWTPEHGPGGGFNPLGETSRVGEVLIHIASDDIEADLKRAEALGGSVEMPKTEIPNIGWWGLFKDPVGNPIAVYTAMNPPETESDDQ